MEILNVLLSTIIGSLSIWAVLTPKVKTSSLCTLGFFVMFLGACVNLEQPIFKNFMNIPGQTILDLGISIVMIVWFYRIEIIGSKKWKLIFSSK